MRIASALLLPLLLSSFAACAASAPAPARRETTPVAAAPALPAPAPEAPSCEEAAHHVLELMMSSEEMQKATPEERQMAESMMKGLEQEIVQDCMNRSWDAAARRCIMECTKPDDLERCDVEGEGAAEGTAPATGTTASARPSAATGIPECDEYRAVAARFQACAEVPAAAREAQKDALAAFESGIATLRDPNVPPEALKAAADACAQSSDALEDAMEAIGCSSRPAP